MPFRKLSLENQKISTTHLEASRAFSALYKPVKIAVHRDVRRNEITGRSIGRVGRSKNSLPSCDRRMTHSWWVASILTHLRRGDLFKGIKRLVELCEK